MAIKRHSLHRTFARSERRVEGEGVLRMLLLAVAVAMPLAAVAYLRIQDMRLGYEMKDIQELIRKEEEQSRLLELEKSKLSRLEVVQQWAASNGFVPATATNAIGKFFTQKDQEMAKLRPVPSI
ncbi:MAG: hypothetical protein FWG02_06260 [Holophagaceae bacterium]|nr:hypothetical protein [Holophagaceae bacterium]